MSDSATLWTVAHQDPLSMDFLDKNTRVAYHFLLQKIFPSQELNPGLLRLQVDSLPLAPESPITMQYYLTVLQYSIK